MTAQVSQTSNLPDTTSTSRPIPVADRAIDNLVSICLNSVFSENGVVVSLRVPTPDERAKIESRLRQLAAILQPASALKNGSHRLAVAITSMLSGYLNAKPADAKATTAAYVAELSQYPAWAVERACRAVSSGQVSGLSPDFPPSAPRIAQIAQTHLAEHHHERARIQMVLAAKLAYVPTEGERERIAAGFQELKTVIEPRADEREARRKAEHAQRAREASNAEVRRAREAAGLPPVEPGQMPVSPSLLKTLPQARPAIAAGQEFD